jgi:hypothetical protein
MRPRKNQKSHGHEAQSQTGSHAQPANTRIFAEVFAHGWLLRLTNSLARDENTRAHWFLGASRVQRVYRNASGIYNA